MNIVSFFVDLISFTIVSLAYVFIAVFLATHLARQIIKEELASFSCKILAEAYADTSDEVRKLEQKLVEKGVLDIEEEKT